jgi:hypothetical protein
MRKLLLVSVAALALLGYSTVPARADIDFGDLEEVFDNLIEFLEVALLEGIEPGAELVIGRLEQLLGIAGEVPLGEPIVAYPETYEAAVEFTTELQQDRLMRADAIDGLTQGYLELAPDVAEQLVALEALNAAPPVSVASQIQIGNQAALLQANELSVSTAALTALTALQTDQARQEVEGAIRSRQWQEAANANGMFNGREGFQAGEFNLPY